MKVMFHSFLVREEGKEGGEGGEGGKVGRETKGWRVVDKDTCCETFYF
jgi:hypothetical protein